MATFTTASGLRIRLTARVFMTMLTARGMTDVGKMTGSMDLVQKSGRMERGTKASINKEEKEARAAFLGPTVPIMTAIFPRTTSMARVSTSARTKEGTGGSGSRIACMGR